MTRFKGNLVGFFEMKECLFLQNKVVQDLKLSQNFNAKSCFSNPTFLPNKNIFRRSKSIFGTLK